MVVVRSQIKEVISELEVPNMSKDFLDTLDNKVRNVIEDACKRAKKNGRRTVMGKDI